MILTIPDDKDHILEDALRCAIGVSRDDGLITQAEEFEGILELFIQQRETQDLVREERLKQKTNTTEMKPSSFGYLVQ